MFTGIVTDIGEVRAARRGAGGLSLVVGTAYDTARIALGASIGCSGVCLTATALEPGSFAVDVSGETLARSTLGDWREGTRINLEQSLTLGDEMGGHLVLGHVDGVAQVVARRPEGDSVRFTVEAPRDLAPFIAEKGSVALDGVSLTINEVSGTRFGVNIIPHTLAHTTFGGAEPGTRMNLEIDLIARYVGRLLAARGSELMADKPPHVLLVEAPYYTHIAALLREGAENALAAAAATFEAVQVPGAFEIPGAIGMAAKAGGFDGYVALGCVIRGETTHYDHICEETAHWLQRLAVQDGLPIGYGILTCENEAQALARATPGGNGRDKGGEATNACLAMIAVKRRFGGKG